MRHAVELVADGIYAGFQDIFSAAQRRYPCQD
jgi:hypothetical protein